MRPYSNDETHFSFICEKLILKKDLNSLFILILRGKQNKKENYLEKTCLKK